MNYVQPLGRDQLQSFNSSASSLNLKTSSSSDMQNHHLPMFKNLNYQIAAVLLYSSLIKIVPCHEMALRSAFNGKDFQTHLVKLQK